MLGYVGTGNLFFFRFFFRLRERHIQAAHWRMFFMQHNNERRTEESIRGDIDARHTRCRFLLLAPLARGGAVASAAPCIFAAPPCISSLLRNASASRTSTHSRWLVGGYRRSRAARCGPAPCRVRPAGGKNASRGATCSVQGLRLKVYRRLRKAARASSGGCLAER